MSVLFHQSARRVFLQTLAITLLFLTTTLAHAAQVTLAWDPNNPTPDGYQVFQRTAGQTYNYASPVWPQSGDNPQATTCTIDNLSAGTTYYFVVRAYSGSDQSGDSNEVQFDAVAPAPTQYTITATAGVNGSISPGTVTIDTGGSQAFNITPNAGYHIADVLVDGNSVGAVGTYTFSQVNAEHTISAAFAVNTFTITGSAGTHGSISPSGAVSVNYGASRAFTISPASGYHVADVLVDGSSVGAVTSYSFTNVSASHTISASFAINTYTITASAGTHGSISPSGAVSVNYGASGAFTISPATGYHVADVLVDGSSVGAVTSYSFTNVSASHTISASFAINTYTITASAGTHGSISPSGAVSVNYGASGAFTISPATGYHVSDVQVDGHSIGAVSAYTFSNVTAAHSIAAAFEANTFTITSTAATGGTISPSGQVSVSSGSSQSFSVSADEGYEIGTLTVDGLSLGAQSDYTFSNVQANHTIAATFTRTNQSPVADAGPDQVVDEAQVVTLSGLNSQDPDDGIVQYQWRQTQGEPVVLDAPDQEVTTFTAPDVDMTGQALVFELTVTDSHGVAASDTCIVNVTWVNEAPTAQAGVDQTVREGDSVTLSAAASTDPDDGIVRYEWLQLQGPQVTLTDSHSAAPGFTAPAVGSQGASLLFQLTVTDAGGLQDTDTCKVTVTWDNTEPTANAGADQQVVAGTEVTLDGSQSMDPDGSSLLYQWRQTDGPPVVLSDSTAVRPIFTVPLEGFDGSQLVFELTVTDEQGLQGIDACQVAVASAATPQDTESPVLQITKPTASTVLVTKNKIDISGRASDNQQVDRVVWTTDDGRSGVASGTTSWYISALRLHRWVNRITITAYDPAGNSQSQTITAYAFYR